MIYYNLGQDAQPNINNLETIIRLLEILEEAGFHLYYSVREERDLEG
jgi:hypothetical protein